MKNVNFVKAIMAGLIGTIAMTGMMLVSPMIGMPPMNIGKMLGSMMGGITAIGWMAHFMIGIMLAVIYAVMFSKRLPGPSAIRGMIFSLLPWLFAQLVLMPMMGAGLFSGSMLKAGGSLMGHLLFGAIVGAFYAKEGCLLTDKCPAKQLSAK